VMAHQSIRATRRVKRNKGIMTGILKGRLNKKLMGSADWWSGQAEAPNLTRNKLRASVLSPRNQGFPEISRDSRSTATRNRLPDMQRCAIMAQLSRSITVI
jgi:hypothetical protein